MDELSAFRRIIKEQIHECAKRFVQVEFEVSPVFDDEHGHYLLMLFGRQMDTRVHDAIFHCRLQNGKVWIELDEAFGGITYALVEAGIPRDKIVLAMHSPWKRQFTEFAVA